MLGEVVWPEMEDLRVDTWVQTGTEVTHNYDSLLAKVMVHKPTRTEAIAAMSEAITLTRVKGIPTNCQLLTTIMVQPDFVSGLYTTHLLEGMPMQPLYMEVRTYNLHVS